MQNIAEPEWNKRDYCETSLHDSFYLAHITISKPTVYIRGIQDSVNVDIAITTVVVRRVACEAILH